MAIGKNGSLFYSLLHVSDGSHGFYPYTISVKRNGTYIEGNMGHLLHMSLHHGPDQKFTSHSQCHLTIPSEINPQVLKYNFSSRHYFKWLRRRALNGGFYQAGRLIFPRIYAESTYAQVGAIDQPVISIPLRHMAIHIEFWYGGSDTDGLNTYLKSFGEPVALITLPHGESVGINITFDTARDYSVYQAMDNFGTYTITSNENPTIEPTFQLHVGQHGENCFGILHGKPKLIK